MVMDEATKMLAEVVSLCIEITGLQRVIRYLHKKGSLSGVRLIIEDEEGHRYKIRADVPTMISLAESSIQKMMKEEGSKRIELANMLMGVGE